MAEWGRYIKVKPAEIREGAAAAEDIAQVLRKNVDFARDDSRAACSAHQGFEATAALDAALVVCENNYRRLADAVDGVAERLTKCADRYDESDQRGAQVFAGITAHGDLG